MKWRRSWRDRLLDVERRRQPTVSDSHGGDGRVCLLPGFRGNSSNFLADESHYAVSERWAIERSLDGVTRTFRKMRRRNDRVHTRHPRGL
jgi:hypothetical protein